MKKELIIYLSVLLVMTFAMHYEALLESPIEHIINLPKSGAYGFGLYHPFIFSAIGYFIILIPRQIVGFFKYKKKGR